MADNLSVKAVKLARRLYVFPIMLPDLVSDITNLD
jgi:hypothetical protein